MKHEKLYIIGIAVGLALLAVLGTLASRVAPEGEPIYTSPSPSKPVPREPSPSPAPTEAPPQASCESAGGTWNECGSACRGASPDTVCILMCVQYCECTSDAQCPDGYSCGDYVDGTGVCNPK